MKRILTLVLLMATISACTEKADESTPIISKQDFKVENGHFTPEIMHQLGKVSDPQISPDGKQIMYGVTYTSIELNKSNRQLFVMDIDGENQKQLTFNAKSISNARWIDNGKRIAYLQGGQIWTINANGSEAKQITDFENGIGEFKFSGDGKILMFTSEVKVDVKPSDVYPDIDKSSARTYTELKYRHWDHFVENIPHTFYASFEKDVVGEPIDILDGAPFELPTEPFDGIEQINFSPDSKYIAYSCRKLTGRDYVFSTNTDIYLYNLSTKETENLTEDMMGYDTYPVFSPDGSKIAWCSMERDGYEADRIRLFIMDLATREKKELSDGFIYDVESPVWAPDGETIYFTSCVNALSEIWKTDLSGNRMRVTPEREMHDFGAASLLVSDGQVQKIITTFTSMLRSAEIASIDPTTGAWEQISHENDVVYALLKEPKVEERWIPTTDGQQMLTWVVYPPDFDPSKVYPAILVCCGGPQSTISQSWSTRWNERLMASQGYIVVYPNRRGAKGMGQPWCEQISGDYIGQNMQDYLAAADALLAEPYVGKMGAAGASYGGYSIYYLAGIHNNRFSAFIAHSGIFNQESMYTETEEMWFPNWDNGGCFAPWEYMSGSPWSKFWATQRHYNNSPHKLVQNWNTPILVTHGELDYRVPVGQGMAAFNSAQMMGVPSKLILFPDENHWILKPQNSIYWNREFFGWFDKYLK